jgi:hypothetical protein
MTAIIKEHKSAFFLAGVLFLLVYRYYAVVDPLLLRWPDDWQYFGIFASQPIPRIGWWNVTRLLPEHLMPTTGYLSAFLIYPLVGDYFDAASISLAIVVALFIVALFLVFYRLFAAPCKNNRLALFVAVMTIAMCFAVFKDNPTDNVHMFFTGIYSEYFYYVLPNILNSIIVLALMRQLVLEDHLSLWPLKENGFSKGWLLVGIYFCIFSMLFSAAILLIFAVAVIVYRCFPLWRSEEKRSQRWKNMAVECVKHCNIALIIIGGTIAAMFLELTSMRSHNPYGDIYFDSVFSKAFAKRVGESAYLFFLHVRSINKYVFVIMVLVVVTAGVIYFRKRQTDRTYYRFNEYMPNCGAAAVSFRCGAFRESGAALSWRNTLRLWAVFLFSLVHWLVKPVCSSRIRASAPVFPLYIGGDNDGGFEFQLAIPVACFARQACHGASACSDFYGSGSSRPFEYYPLSSNCFARRPRDKLAYRNAVQP